MPIIEDLPSTPVRPDEDQTSKEQELLGSTIGSVQSALTLSPIEFLKMINIGPPTSIRPRKKIRAWETGASNTFGARKTALFNFGEVEKYDHGQQNVSTDNKKKKHYILRKIVTGFDDYCDNSTLHGLRYIGNNNLSATERIFWLVSFLCAFAFAMYFIVTLFMKFNSNPVIVSFSPTMENINKIPFPAITICSVNIARKDVVEFIDKNGSPMQKKILADMCDKYGENFTDSGADDNADWLSVKKLIIEINQKCEDMFKMCFWENRPINCEAYINSVLTDEGYCCAFNKLPLNYSLRNAVDEDLNETYPGYKVDWNAEDGYPSKVPPDVYPLRSAGPGSHLGLTVVMDADLDNYFCTTTSGMGFKVFLANPTESPKIADFGFLIAPGDETRVAIRPSILSASEGIVGIDVDKRQCFFAFERYLQFYRTYSQRNCRQECQANYTLQECGCVPYYLPKNSSTRICGKKKEDCALKAKITSETSNSVGNCNCLAGCNELSFEPISVTIGKIKAKYNNTVDTKFRGDVSHEYFAENYAIASFFYTSNTFIKQVKTELYGFSEFLSNTGGLLGLFMGFSFLSGVEILYFLILKTACGIYKHKKKKRATKQQQEKFAVASKEASGLPYTK